jgi:hypothetical protein
VAAVGERFHGATTRALACPLNRALDDPRNYFASLEPPSSTFPSFLMHLLK